MSKQSTYRDRVAQYFREHAGRWIDGLALEQIGGRYAWRSRISDCRTHLRMDIRNRQREAQDGATISEYCYLPPTPVVTVQTDLHDANSWGLR